MKAVPCVQPLAITLKELTVIVSGMVTFADDRTVSIVIAR